MWMTTKGLSVLDNSTSENNRPIAKSLEKQTTNNNTLENNDIDLGIDEDKQTRLYESLVVEINELKEDLLQTKKELNEKVAYQMQCNENAIRSVNTSISGASYALGVFTIVIVVGGIFLGFYITLVERKVRNLTNENKSILENHLKIKDDVEKLDKNINKNMGEVYNKLKREETKALVERLVKVPEDILNLFDNLASREVPNELFPQFKEAYQKLKCMPPTNDKVQYLTLFFQHFPSLSLFEEDLENEIEGMYTILMDASFKNDIIKTSCEFLIVCMEDGILHWRKKIKKYFIALSSSNHKDLPELHTEIYKTLSTKENRFNLYSILHAEGVLKAVSKIYGQKMLNDYKDVSGNTESEKLVLKEIAQESEGEKKA